MRRQHALRRETDVCNLVLGSPAGTRALDGDVAGVCAVAVQARERGLVFRVDQVPGQDEGVVAAGGEEAAFVGRPFDAVEVSLVAAELEEGGARLAHVEDAD